MIDVVDVVLVVHLVLAVVFLFYDLFRFLFTLFDLALNRGMVSCCICCVLIGIQCVFEPSICTRNFNTDLQAIDQGYCETLLLDEGPNLLVVWFYRGLNHLSSASG